MIVTAKPLRVLMGGTFDPVHVGHLRIAIEIRELLGVAHAQLLPCYLPVHRAHPARSAAHRLAMLSLAVESCDGLEVDDREIARGGPSYTVDTLKDIRQEIGEDAALAIVIGQDTFNQFSTWKDWARIPELAHVVVVTRPGYLPDAIPEALHQFTILRDPTEIADYVHQRPSGSLSFLTLSMLSVSSSEIRERLSEGKSVKYLLPDKVIEYIGRHKLYRE